MIRERARKAKWQLARPFSAGAPPPAFRYSSRIGVAGAQVMRSLSCFGQSSISQPDSVALCSSCSSSSSSSSSFSSSQTAASHGRQHSTGCTASALLPWPATPKRRAVARLNGLRVQSRRFVPPTFALANKRPRSWREFSHSLSALRKLARFVSPQLGLGRPAGRNQLRGRERILGQPLDRAPSPWRVGPTLERREPNEA